VPGIVGVPAKLDAWKGQCYVSDGVEKNLELSRNRNPSEGLEAWPLQIQRASQQPD